MTLFERPRSAGRSPSNGKVGDAANPEQDARRLIEEGNVIEDEGRLEEALRCYDAAIRMAPDLVRAHMNRGNVLLASGNIEGALGAYATAIAKDRGYALAHYNMGMTYTRAGRHGEARAAFESALALKPDFVDAEVALGYSLEELGQLDAAAACYRRALDINPNYAEVHSNLGNVLRSLGQLDAALASYRRAIEINPDYADVQNNLGNVLQDLGQVDAAVECYRRALSLKPDFANAHTSLLFSLSHQEATGPRALYDEHCDFGEKSEAPLRASWPRHTNTRDPTRCLQIGFVSGDLRQHAVTSFVEPLLARLAGSAALSLQIYFNHATEDSVSARLRSYVRRWHHIVGLSDAALAERITSDRIDILIDLSGHTAENRLLTFARKPAPVQVSWIGYPGTTGLQAMDYYVADRHFLPPGTFDSQFTEKLVYLPANAPFLLEATAPEVNALPALRNGYVTFGSFNRLNKLRPPVIALWSRLLRSLPDARMVLGGMPHEAASNPITDWFARESVTSERLRLHPRVDTGAYLALHHQVDMCLDTFPYSGGTTTNHALWMGVPTLTLAGHTPPGRQGAAMLGHVGLEAFVARDADDFLAKGLHWASDLAALAAVRSGLRQRIEQSAVCPARGHRDSARARVACHVATLVRRTAAGIDRRIRAGQSRRSGR